MTGTKQLAIGTLAALAVGATVIFFDRSMSAREWGGAMMERPRSEAGANSDYGPWHGRGVGMMDGSMGLGRMGGMWYGMGGPHYQSLAALDLKDAQRKQVLSIQDEARRKNWAAMGAMQDEMAKLRDAFWAGEKRDRAAILASNKRMFEIRQQMLETSLDAADKIDEVLTPQQRALLKKQAGPAWMLDRDE